MLQTKCFCKGFKTHRRKFCLFCQRKRLQTVVTRSAAVQMTIPIVFRWSAYNRTRPGHPTLHTTKQVVKIKVKQVKNKQISPLSTFSTTYLYPDEKGWLPTAFLRGFLNRTLFFAGLILSMVALSAVQAWNTTKSTPCPDLMDSVQSALMSPCLKTKPILFASSHS